MSKDNDQKVFRDFFGKEIKIGDRVLHLWATVSGRYIEGGESAIKHKIAKVIGFGRKGVSIEWRTGRQYIKTTKSTVFNTRNRLIILKDDMVEVDRIEIYHEAARDYESYKKKMRTESRKLKATVDAQRTRIENLVKEKEKIQKKLQEQTKEFERIKSTIYRFEIMDIEE